MKKFLATLLPFVAACIALGTSSALARQATDMQTVEHLQDNQVIEFRRYVTEHGERAHFVKYFDAYFPEAFEQLGAMVFGQFTERGNPNHFTWLRGFKDLSARPIIESAFYYGPVWKEHRIKVNAILPDSDNVMLMRPLHPERGVLVLPAVDPVVEENGAQGIVVAQIFSVKKGSEDAFARQAEQAFAAYSDTGVRTAGLLVSLDVPNNFPQLPIRSDGPFLVWLGVVRDDAALAQITPRMTSAEHALATSGLLRSAPERLVMDPTPRSRLRWLTGMTDATP
ncbi:NIPSNAP family protein [Rhodanobacter sp. L36]|uniref:NIPSNAP family protein n=1 Tax=Rhodanobacter sp. L36 TaxID=1747221 RepID=UPI00131DD43A|nr:NIPSNAP family protein [Rhodanobacter sp. L36]